MLRSSGRQSSEVNISPPLVIFLLAFLRVIAVLLGVLVLEHAALHEVTAHIGLRDIGDISAEVGQALCYARQGVGAVALQGLYFGSAEFRDVAEVEFENHFLYCILLDVITN